MTQKKSDLSPALLALTAAAMNLPGLANVAHGATTINKPTLGYRFTQYSEDDQGGQFSGGSERYTVDTNQFRILLPIDEFAQANIDLLAETMSGASPIAVAPPSVAGGEPIQLMSGATIEDERTDAQGSLLLTKGLNTVVTRVGVSDENDYSSFSGGVEWGHELSSRLTTLTTGFGFSLDEINPTDGGTQIIGADGVRVGRPGSEDKETYSGFFGVTRVLTNNSAVQTGLTLTYNTGLLSDPYKEVFVVNRGTSGGLVSDNRPDTRTQAVWLTQYRQFFANRNSALNADYRFYIDDWGSTSHTVDLAWHQNFKGRWKVIPSLRYYTQSRTDFYQVFFDTVPADLELSSDYRLSPYGAISARFRAEKQLLERWTFNLSVERYTSGGDLTLGSVGVEAPGLVDFWSFSIGVDASF